MIRKNLFYVIMLLLFSSLAIKAQVQSCNLLITDGLQNEKLKQTIEKNVTDFLNACNIAAIKAEKPELNKQATTSEARKDFLNIWETSPLRCFEQTLERKCLKRPAGGFQIRDIPVSMSAAPKTERWQQIAFVLTPEGKIDDVIIQISQYTDLLDRGIKVKDTDLRLIVLDFVENYRTAYNRKDIKFISTMFSENAVIITGKEIKQTKQKPPEFIKQNAIPTVNSKNKSTMFEYQVKNKTEYIDALKRVFKNNAYIEVNFDSIEVIRYPNEKYSVYGVTIKQDWKSSNYNDIGYLFLLINFKDQENPVITVRTWQPEMYQGRYLRREEIFNIHDFIKEIL